MMNKQKGFVIPIVVAIIALLVLGGGTYVYVNKKAVDNSKINFPDIVNNLPTSTTTKNNPPVISPIACTMDAKMCPDGSYVGRTGPKCEFVCPIIDNQTSNWKTYTDTNNNITLKYPSSWTYQKFSCNTEGVAFCPLTGHVSLNCGQTCGADSPESPIYLYTDGIAYGVVPSLVQWNKSVEYKQIFNEMTASFTFNGSTIDIPPPLGNSTLKINCNSEGCNTSGVNSTRSDFYLTVDGTKVKVLIDIETRLRYVASDFENGIKTESEILKKWAEFYPLLKSQQSLGMPYSFQATIYGDWIDATTFKANWIKWDNLGY